MATREERDTRQLFADRYGEDRRARLCAIEDGLLRRSLLVAASPKVVS